MLLGKRGQATTEFVVLGSLILMAFYFLINYSEKLNRQQSYMQQSFRVALKEARNANHSASYTKVGFRRMPNVMSPMELGQMQSFSGSANVLWADGQNTAEHGVSKYQLNEATAIDIPYRETPSEGTVETSSNRFVNEVETNILTTKTENAGNIVTTKSITAKDTLDASVSLSGSTYSFTHTLGEGGKYYSGDHTLTRTRTMQ
ncbi:MAG: hypothetical protein WC293_01915 [Candidatus Omnitrophota bacterium]|jgi:prepilin-type processing-associated H-X9-DG protein